MGDVVEFLEEWGSEVPEEPLPVPYRNLPKPRSSLSSDGADASCMIQPGVYALLYKDKVVYIGKARVIARRIYTHHLAMRRRLAGLTPKLNGPKIKPKDAVIFNGLRIWPCQLDELDRLERKLIAKYQPRHNANLLPKGKVTFEQIGFDLTRLGIAAVKATPTLRRTFSPQPFVRRI